MQKKLTNYYETHLHDAKRKEPRDHPLISLLRPGDLHLAGQTQEEQLVSEGIYFVGSYFAVANLQLIAVDAFAFVSSVDGRAYEEDQLVVAFTNMAQPALAEGAYLFEIQREIVLLCSGDSASSATASMQQSLERLGSLADELAGIRMFAVYSDPAEGLPSIAKSHDLCRQLRQWRVFHLDITPVLGPEVLRTPLACSERGHPVRRDIELEDSILSDFKAGRFREARDTMRDLFSHEYLALAEPLVLLKHKCAQYLSALAGACCEICETDITPQFDVMHPERRLLAAQTYPEVRAQMEHCFGYLNDLTLALRKQEQGSWVLDVKNYVRDNFADPNLNVNAIADHFGKNAAYLSRSFLRQTGSSVLEYIHRYRVQEAKIRIGRGDTLPNVAEAVGYGSVLTMSRAFKKYEGVTPGKLR